MTNKLDFESFRDGKVRRRMGSAGLYYQSKLVSSGLMFKIEEDNGRRDDRTDGGIVYCIGQCGVRDGAGEEVWRSGNRFYISQSR